MGAVERYVGTATDIPFIASGLVNSRTRWPASNPSPSTCMTTYCSSLMDIRAREAGSRVSRMGKKRWCAQTLEQAMEHSTGVIETFTNGYL